MFNQFSTITKQLHTCVLIFQNLKMSVETMKQAEAVRDAFKKELNNYEPMKLVANAYINKKECSIQECVYHILPGKWQRKTFPRVMFANSNIPEKTFSTLLS